MNTGISRPLARPLVAAVTAGPRSLFSPAALFANGEQGAWYDPSDLSTLFQDAAGTIPAALNQPVGLMRDKSGRGNHASQATAAARPVLQQDAGGRYYLAFDGVDDALLIPSAPAGGAVASMVVAGVRYGASASEYIYAEQSPLSVMPINCQLQGLSSKPRAAYRNDVGDLATPTGATNFNGVNCVFAGTNDESGSAIRVNGAVAATGASVSGTISTSHSTIGGARGGTVVVSSVLNGRVYGLVVRAGAYTPAQFSSTESYIATKSGVSLA